MAFLISRRVLKGAAALIAASALIGWLEADPVRRFSDAPPSYVHVAGLVLIAHAGGGLPAATYTNSREAFDLSVQHGFCLIETDFRFARDGELVLMHDWSNAYAPMSQVGLALFGPPTSTDYAGRPTRDGLTAQDLPALLSWMSSHPQVSVITDTKDDNVRFLRALAPRVDAAIKSRLIVQIYEPSELPEAKSLGFDHIIFTLYKTDMTDAEVIAFARQKKLFGVTMPVARAHEGLAAALAATGTRVFVHTVNSPDEAAALKRDGVAGLYTDYLTPAEPCAQSRDQRHAEQN
jgi:glycerophosphoryl diester phosphodiesterase